MIVLYWGFEVWRNHGAGENNFSVTTNTMGYVSSEETSNTYVAAAEFRCLLMISVDVIYLRCPERLRGRQDARPKGPAGPGESLNMFCFSAHGRINLGSLEIMQGPKHTLLSCLIDIQTCKRFQRWYILGFKKGFSFCWRLSFSGVVGLVIFGLTTTVVSKHSHLF